MKPTTGIITDEPVVAWEPTGNPSEAYRLHREVVRLTDEVEQLRYAVFALLTIMFAIVAATV